MVEKSKVNSKAAVNDAKAANVAKASAKKDEIKSAASKPVAEKKAEVKAEDKVVSAKSAEQSVEAKVVVKASDVVKASGEVKDDAVEEKKAKDEEDGDVEYEEVEVEEEKVDEKGVVTKVKVIKKVAKKAAKEEKKAEEAPVYEPTSVFIDRGAILPEFLPGTHLFALIRDPGTLYTYWNSEIESPNGWRVTAFDAAGNVLQSFQTTHRRGGRGYFHVETARVSRVTLEMVKEDGQIGLILESKIKIVEQSRHRPGEKWVDFQDQHVVYEAPSMGHAPEYRAPVVPQDELSMVGGGGIEAMVSGAPKDLVPGMSPSSWFGPFRAPGSSDIFMGASDNNLRRK